MSNPDNLFEVIAIRGYCVTCSKRQWENHITFGYPEVIDKLDVVAQTISNPDRIYESEKHCNRDVYFRDVGQTKTSYLKVVVEISANFGEVITAFETENVKGNINMEVCKYVKPQL